jgi:serine protease
VSRASLRRFLFTFAGALALFVLTGVRGRGQNAGEAPTLLYPYSLPAIDRGLSTVEGPEPMRLATASRARFAAPIDRIGRAGARYAPGRVLVKFRDGTPTAVRLNSVARVSAAGTVSERPSYANFDVLSIDANADAESVADALSERPDVEYAQPAYRMYKRFVPNDQFYQQAQWNMRLIDMERAWDLQPAAGSTLTVAVLDSGMAFENVVLQFTGRAFVDDLDNQHAALGTVAIQFAAAPDLISSGRIVGPRDFIFGGVHPVDLDGHGTHVAGTLGELTNNGVGLAGIAFNVKLMPVKVIGGDWDAIFGASDLGSDGTVAQGIRYAADNGAKVINLSVGRNGPPAPAVEDAMRYAVARGVFIAVAGGNQFQQGNDVEVLAEIASRVQGAISVAAVDPTKNHAYYSSTGNWVEIAAPGGAFRDFGTSGGVFQQTLDLAFGMCLVEPDACGTRPSFDAPRFDAFNYFGFAGTSMATPHVAGLAALLMQQGITNPAAVEAAIERFATDLGAPGRDAVYGYGLIEARDTLRGLGLAK